MRSALETVSKLNPLKFITVGKYTRREQDTVSVLETK
jgi:hypothetical protein